MKRISFHPVVSVHGILVMVDATIVPGRPAPICHNPSSARYSDPGEPLEVEYSRVISAETCQDLTPLFVECEELNKFVCDGIVRAWQSVGSGTYRRELAGVAG